MPAVLARIEARRAGLDVAANVYPYNASSTGLTALAPTWALEGGYPAFLRRLKEPATRAKILRRDLRAELVGFLNRLGGASGVLVTQLHNPAFAQYQRKRLDGIATLMGVGPMEALLRLYESGTASPDAIYFSMSDEDMKAALAKPWVSVGADSAAVVGKGRDRAGARRHGAQARRQTHTTREAGRQGARGGRARVFPAVELVVGHHEEGREPKQRRRRRRRSGPRRRLPTTTAKKAAVKKATTKKATAKRATATKATS